MEMRNFNPIPIEYLELFPQEVLSALLWHSAQWRNIDEMEALIKMGAKVNETHQGKSVLDKYMIGTEKAKWWTKKVDHIEKGVRMLAGYGVTGEDVKDRSSLDREVIGRSEYLTEFFE
jgi:hypothetical protein